MNSQIELTVVIPAYNEEEGLPRVLPELLECCLERGWKVIVVNDCSTDDTAGALAPFEPEVKVMHNEVNLGYGASLKRGIRAAETEWVAMFDADGQHRVKDLIKLSGEVVDSDAAVGMRTNESHATLIRKPGKWVLGKVANILVGRKIPDINCGLRVMRRRAITSILRLASDKFSFSTSTLVAMLKRGLKVKFVSVTTEERVGKSTVKQFRDGFHAIFLIMRLIMLFDPLRIFFPIALGMFAVGSLYQIVMFFLHGLHIYNTTVLLCIAGLIVFFLALVADQVSAMRRELTDLEQDIGRDIERSCDK